MIPVSVVIPTCNRKQALLALLDNLYHCSYPLQEVIIVSAGEEPLSPADYAVFKDLPIIHLRSTPSVCAQRNAGILSAKASLIFICDDDMEVPRDYLQKLVTHIRCHPEAGAVSGLVLQKENGEWKGSYPILSSWELLFRFIFGLGIWGEINCKTDRGYLRKIKRWYRLKGNHISKSGWPVLTDFSGDYFLTPVYGLGASLIRKDWLLSSPYDEYLDSHGIGDHYGVAAGFPGTGIHIVNAAVVYHHQSVVNRLQHAKQYFRRILALDYFIRRHPRLAHVHKVRLLWSLSGNLLLFLKTWDLKMVGVSVKALCVVAAGRNPYYKAFKAANGIHFPPMGFPVNNMHHG